VLKCQYAVRGEIVTLAQNLQKDLQANPGAHSFDEASLWCYKATDRVIGRVGLSVRLQPLR
ncbi:alanine aminotransferase 1, partial [Trifolium medium]|nr:alanine aminotransferase 1 [Trifolium medium]